MPVMEWRLYSWRTWIGLTRMATLYSLAMLSGVMSICAMPSRYFFM